MSQERKVFYKYEVAAMYNVHYSTLKSWLKPHLHQLSNSFTKHRLVKPTDLKIIFTVLGEP